MNTANLLTHRTLDPRSKIPEYTVSACRIEKAAARLLDEAAAQRAVFYERSARSLQRMGARLQTWNKDGYHAAVLGRLQTRVDALCAALPVADAQRKVCEGLLKPTPTKGDA